jgi:hypothetical protein
MANGNVHDTSLRFLLRELIHEITALLRQEFRLAQAETGEKIERAQHSIIAVAAGLLLGFCGLLILLQAAVVALAEVMEPALASLVVGVVVIAVAYVLLRQGQKGLSPSHMMPDRTIDSMRQDRELVLDRVRS